MNSLSKVRHPIIPIAVASFAVAILTCGCSRSDEQPGALLFAQSSMTLPLAENVNLSLIRVGEGAKMFFLGAYEVTQGEYEAVTGETPSFHDSLDYAKLPVEHVSMLDALVFCQKLNERFEKELNGLVCTLPTKEQWELAAAAGRGTDYSGSDQLDIVGWSFDNAKGTTQPVGTKRQNNWGFYDMSGNVSEWSLEEGVLHGTYLRLGGNVHDSSDDCRIHENWTRTAKAMWFRGADLNYTGFRIACVKPTNENMPSRIMGRKEICTRLIEELDD